MKTIAQQLNVKDFPFIIEDKDGNVIYWENSSGFWRKREYDSNGKPIYKENSDGFWERYEYDSNGKLIHCEDSILSLNKRPKSCNGETVVKIDGKKYKLTEI